MGCTPQRQANSKKEIVGGQNNTSYVKKKRVSESEWTGAFNVLHIWYYTYPGLLYGRWLNLHEITHGTGTLSKALLIGCYDQTWRIPIGYASLFFFSKFTPVVIIKMCTTLKNQRWELKVECILDILVCEWNFCDVFRSCYDFLKLKTHFCKNWDFQNDQIWIIFWANGYILTSEIYVEYF